MAKERKQDYVGHPSLSGRGETEKLTIRVPATQQETWRTAAERAGLSLSAWIRQVLDRAARRK